MWGRILLRVRPWAPYLENEHTQNPIRHVKYHLSGKRTEKSSELSNQDLKIASIRLRGLTHVLRVAMRQRHSPSLVLLFLCLKLPNILSHTYCNNTQQTTCTLWFWCQSNDTNIYFILMLTCGLAACSMIFKSRLWSWSRTWSFASPNRSIRLGSTEEKIVVNTQSLKIINRKWKCV